MRWFCICQTFSCPFFHFIKLNLLVLHHRLHLLPLHQQYRQPMYPMYLAKPLFLLPGIVILLKSYITPKASNQHFSKTFMETSEVMGGLHAAPTKKREIDDKSKKLGALFVKLNNGDISQNASEKLVQLCQALDRGDFPTLQIQNETSTENLSKPQDPSSEFNQCNGVMPFELDNKLCHLLLEQQESQIIDLESELQRTNFKLVEKESELQALKDCVKRVTDFSLTCPSDDEREFQVDGTHSKITGDGKTMIGIKRTIDFD